MVNSALPVFLAMLAISRAVGAVPTAAAAVPFTFGQWVEDIIANPDGDHLTADEAVQAFYASANSTQSSGRSSPLIEHIIPTPRHSNPSGTNTSHQTAEHAKRGPLQERAARCYEQPNTEAYVSPLGSTRHQLYPTNTYSHPRHN